LVRFLDLGVSIAPTLEILSADAFVVKVKEYIKKIKYNIARFIKRLYLQQAPHTKVYKQLIL